MACTALAGVSSSKNITLCSGESKIVSAERVEGSEKLLQLKVSLGEEERTLMAGIAKFYSPEELIGMSVSLGFLPAFGFGTLRNGKAFSRSLREGMVGKEEKEDSSERQWKGSGV